MKQALAYRRIGLTAFHTVARALAKLGMGKIRIRGKKLSEFVFPWVEDLVHLGLPETVQVHGMCMYHLVPSEKRGHFSWLYPFGYELETQQAFEQIIKPGMNIVDVGAHIGYYSLLSAKLLKGKGKVYAFEPDPSYHALLKRNILINHLNGLVEEFPLAVAEKKGTATLFLGKSTGTSLFEGPDSTGKTVTVQVISLDEFFSQKGWPPIHLIKLDIEGSEKLALRGMHVLVKKNPSLKLIVELNPSCLEAGAGPPEDLLVLLGELGFHRALTLSKDRKQYNIPQEAQSLVRLARKFNYVNLLCEKDRPHTNA